MTKTTYAAVIIASILFSGDFSSRAAEIGTLGDRLQLAQMDSPGDGLDKRGASEGNARPSGMKRSRLKKPAVRSKKRI